MTPTTAPSGAADVPSPPTNAPIAAARWGKRLGVAAFLFFLVKGLAWLIVPAAVAALAAR